MFNRTHRNADLFDRGEFPGFPQLSDQFGGLLAEATGPGGRVDLQDQNTVFDVGDPAVGGQLSVQAADYLLFQSNQHPGVVDSPAQATGKQRFEISGSKHF